MTRPFPSAIRTTLEESEVDPMSQNAEPSAPAPNDEHRTLSTEYLKRARAAETGGDLVLGMYLYLAAFEEAAADAASPSEDALVGLKQAWVLACSSKERSMAEYIFEKLEPYLSADEIAICADELQSLTLDKLEEFGLSREDLEDVAEMISQDILGGDGFSSDGVMEAPAITGVLGLPSFALHGRSLKRSEAKAADAAPRALPAPEGAEGAQPEERAPKEPHSPLSDQAFGTTGEDFDYGTIAGYESVIKVMRDFGIGVGEDEEFRELVGLLNARHGLASMPAADSLLFRAPAREDANRFIAATVGEVGLPVVRMRMEENLQGMPVLCVSAQASDLPRSGGMRNVFDHGGVLVLEDLDLWSAPSTEVADDVGGFFMMQLSRGAHEAINMVRSAVDNPDVYVLASAIADGEVAPFFLDLMEPLSIIDIELPTPEERVDIWMDLARAHPSLRSINRADLVRYSANMPRFDIYLAVREAIEEAYKLGLMQRRYHPLTRENLFDKLAAYQPLDSSEYRELEDRILQDFRSDLSHIEDLIRGEE